MPPDPRPKVESGLPADVQRTAVTVGSFDGVHLEPGTQERRRQEVPLTMHPELAHLLQRRRDPTDAHQRETGQITGHNTESVYRRYAIVSKRDLRDAQLRAQSRRPAKC